MVFMALRGSVWSAGKLLALGGALIATYLLFAIASVRVALNARDVQVPQLVNRSVNEASSLASANGLTIRVEDTPRLDPKVPAGHVLMQEPPAGTTVRRQRSLKVWVSAGPRPTTIPSLTGETERTAQLRLSQDGLNVATVSEIRSPGYPYDVVVAQDPDGKAPGTSVSLLVNRTEPEAHYVMPDLIGVHGDRAADLLRARGFRVAIVGSTPYPGVSAGVVLRQSPQAGFQIAPGEAISIEVSR
jgi:eukaryotic-like serine/threonine-protein kinase